MSKILKTRAKWSIWGHSSTLGPIRKLQDEATSSLGRVELAWASRAMLQPPPPPPPNFPINRHGGLKGRGSAPLVSKFHWNWWEEEEKRGKIQGQGASVTLLWSIPWTFFAVLHHSSFFDQLVFNFETLNSFYAPLGVHPCFACLHLYFVQFRFLFIRFLRALTDRLCRFLT